jgi:hypothetical protein
VVAGRVAAGVDRGWVGAVAPGVSWDEEMAHRSRFAGCVVWFCLYVVC